MTNIQSAPFPITGRTKPAITITNIKLGFCDNSIACLYKKWSGRLGAAVFALIFLGVAYNIFLLNWR